jgi:hypothetical protein
MSIPLVRASIVTLLLCAACNGSETTGATSTGSGGATASSSDSSSSVSSGAGGSAPGTMDCELTINPDGANVELTEFSSMAGQGNTTHKSGHPIEYGFAATASTTTTIVLLNIVVSGDALTVGADYTAPDAAYIDLTINNVVANTGVHDWVLAPGGIVKVDSLGPGPVDHYQRLTFALSDVPMTPSTVSSENKATGTFKMSGKCSGNIQDLP